MRPLLQEGEIATVGRARPEEVSIGDVVFYRTGGQAHLHRVWWRDKTHLWIKDDAAVIGLHRIGAEEALGRLEGRGILSGGWIGWLYSLATTAVFFLGRYVKRMFKAGRSHLSQLGAG